MPSCQRTGGRCSSGETAASSPAIATADVFERAEESEKMKEQTPCSVSRSAAGVSVSVGTSLGRECCFRGTTLSNCTFVIERERRLMTDLPLMAEHYPELAFGSHSVTGLRSFSKGRSHSSPGERFGAARPVRIVFPRAYPDDEPRVSTTRRSSFHMPRAEAFRSAGTGRCAFGCPGLEMGGVSKRCPARFHSPSRHPLQPSPPIRRSGKWPVPSRDHGRNWQGEVGGETRHLTPGVSKLRSLAR